MATAPGQGSILPHDSGKDPGRASRGDEGLGGHRQNDTHYRIPVQSIPNDQHEAGIDEDRTRTEVGGKGTRHGDGNQSRSVAGEVPSMRT